MAQGSVTVVSGFSGAGKGTIIKALLASNPQYWLSVSVTTRSPRQGEVHGKDYYFIAQEEYDRMVENDGLLEHAGYVGNCYGTPRANAQEQVAAGRDVLLEIEYEGGQQVKSKIAETIRIFIMAPSAAILEQRLRDRKSDTESKIRGRLARAIDECNEICNYDAIVINRDVHEAERELHRTIQALKQNPGTDEVLRPADKTEFIAQFRKDLVERMEALYPVEAERPDAIQGAIGRYYAGLADLH